MLAKKQMQIQKAHKYVALPLVLSGLAFPGHRRCQLVPATEKSKVNTKGKAGPQGHLLFGLWPSEVLFKSELANWGAASLGEGKNAALFLKPHPGLSLALMRGVR